MAKKITKKIVERAMLVALDTKAYSKEVVEEHLAELEELANTAGAETVFAGTFPAGALPELFFNNVAIRQTSLK